jgi:hypothetical protein
MFMRGHFTNQKIMAIDINSAYPASMVKFNFPVGPYYTIDFGGPILFTGQVIPMGCYRIFIEESPITDFPVFFTTFNGRSQPSNIKNTYLWTTSPEIIYAQKCGYSKIYLL